jgi:hypothetical protein
MGAYNEILVGRLNRFLQKYLGMKGDAPSVQLAADWQPSLGFDVEGNVELRYLQGWNKYAISSLLNAIAGQPTGVRLRNPVGSNVVAVVELLSMGTPTATDVMNLAHGPIAADLVTIISGAVARLDPRGNAAPTCVMSTNTAALTSLSSVIAVRRTVANTNVDFILTADQEIPLLPGDALQIQPSTVNEALDFTFWWRERFLEESERS